mgnify:CR=1 FL=1
MFSFTHVTTSRVQSAVQRKEKLLGDWNVPYKTGLEQWHDFSASHHYSGPHDKAGKAPIIKMAQGPLSRLGACVYERAHCLSLLFLIPLFFFPLLSSSSTTLRRCRLRETVHLRLSLLLRVLYEESACSEQKKHGCGRYVGLQWKPFLVSIQQRRGCIQGQI